MTGNDLPPLHAHTPEAIARRLADVRMPSVLKDLVFGGIDGAVTTLAIVAGVQGAGFSYKVIIALGLANILADGFSMAAGNFAGTRAEAEDIERLRAIEGDHIRRDPDGEREELRQILAGKGLSGDALEQAVAAISSRESAWIDMMLVDEYGVSPLAPAPLRAALATFVAFMMAGIVPLAPFLLGFERAFAISLGMTFTVFVFIGAVRGIWSMRSSWWTAAETVLIGGIAAGIAFLIGGLFKG